MLKAHFLPSAMLAAVVLELIFPTDGSLFTFIANISVTLKLNEPGPVPGSMSKMFSLLQLRLA